MHTAAGAQNLIAIFALLFSFAALILSAIFAWRANRISASDPWAALLIERVAEQVVDEDMGHRYSEYRMAWRRLSDWFAKHAFPKPGDE